MTAPERRTLFGTELRRRRTQAGLSLTDLAKLVHDSKSHLSKVAGDSRACLRAIERASAREKG